MKKETFFELVLKLFSGSRHKIIPEDTAIVKKENIWGVSGRKAQMDTRALMQLKPFTSSSKFSK
jgi:hypothetical protein